MRNLKGLEMRQQKFHFVCLDPRKSKKTKIQKCLSGLGTITWLKFAFVRLGSYPQTNARAQIALECAKKPPKTAIISRLKLTLLKWQYNWSRNYFERHPDCVAVAWNGLNGTRRVFMDAAKDSGIKRLYFELCPFEHRITIDPCGVNFQNSVPRDPAFFLTWARENGSDDWKSIRDTIRARKSKFEITQSAPANGLDDPFIFLPLQVPGDSQLRIFGGNYQTVQHVLNAASAASTALPDGWSIRIKEHPTSNIRFDKYVVALNNPKLILDNVTDTFEQVSRSKAVLCVNSSVGLEAMFFDKPVIAMGDCFWAIPGIAEYCPTDESLKKCVSSPEILTFSPKTRAAFMSYLIDYYYPLIGNIGDDSTMPPAELQKIISRL